MYAERAGAAIDRPGGAEVFMLNASGRFTIDELPGLLLYPDDRHERGVYAIRAMPRVATDEHGLPQISLALYGRREGPELRVRGGVLTLTTTLQLIEKEDRALRAALAHRLVTRASPSGGPAAPAAELLSPDWLQGDVQVRLTRELALPGKPSLIGVNNATFSRKLDAAEAQGLKKAWDDGLGDGWIRYRLQLRGPAGRSTFQAREATQGERSETSFSERSSFDVTASRTESRPTWLTLEGPFGLTAGDLAHRLTIVNM